MLNKIVLEMLCTLKLIDPMYLNYVTVRNGKTFANWGIPSWFSWDNKLAATQVHHLEYYKSKDLILHLR